MIARPELGALVPLAALAYRGESCLTKAPGTRLACCMATHHEEPFHVAYQVDNGALVVDAVWDGIRRPTEAQKRRALGDSDA